MRRPSSVRSLLMDLPIPWKLSLIIGLFSIAIFGLLALSYFGMEILSGSRAYVGGEGLWSKAQKGAVYRLTRYALFHEEADYQKYLDHIAISRGDHEARMELGRPRMNFAAVERGFEEGRNHPDDIRTMAFMARQFNKFPYMSKAIDLWGQADGYIDKLQSTAAALHQEISSGHASPARIKMLLKDIEEIETRITPIEDAFSYTLGAGARWLKTFLLTAMVLCTGIFFALSLAVAVMISRHLCQEIDQLRAGATRIAGGDYSLSLNIDSKDEVGDLARTFEQMAAQRQQAERLKDEFFANVSHELRTPLTLILSPLESIMASGEETKDPRTASALGTMHNNAVRLLQLVNGLLDFSKLEADKIHVSREPLRVAALTEMVYNDFLPLIKERGLSSQIEMAPTEAVVMMDHYLYERILFNLLSNAVKFTKPGGQVNVRLEMFNGELILSVSDTGIGIPVGERENIFERFRQVEGSSTRRFEGTGLGLALVKEFTVLLDGSVSVESEPGHGSTFTVRCMAPPAEHDEKAISVFPRTSRKVSLQSYDLKPALVSEDVRSSDEQASKVLIAEDNMEMASYIASLLEPFCRIQIARDGNDALKRFQEWRPDLLLTDVMMPERDGLSLCQTVKSNPKTAKTPVVMLTALIHREALLEGWKAGADEYLFKPFHPTELVTRIRSLLKTRRAEEYAERKISQLNEELRRHAQELETANQELEAFSYSVSHDLRAPLRAIDGFSLELLNGQDQLNSRGKEDLARIRAAAQRMARLIEDLLELSRLSRSELKRAEINLSAMVKSIAQDLQKSNPERNVEWSISPGVMAQGDPHLLQVALQNLVQNAWKFTQRKENAKIEFGTLDREGKRSFFIRDDGAGFSMAYAGKLFKPFQRLHDAKDFPGTGIGLALVQRIIQRHGGDIDVEAEENKGAVFYFTLAPSVQEITKGSFR